MSLSHPYQLKGVTDFVLHNFIQSKEKLILVDDFEWNYTEIIQGNSGKSRGLAPYYYYLQQIDHRYSPKMVST
jgi:hypothetical protein